MSKDRFGIPDSAIEAAKANHGGILRLGMYVPTREEVRTMAPDPLYINLDQWMWESPAELIPRMEQIAEVLSELLTRPDQEAIRHIVAACQAYQTVDAG